MSFPAALIITHVLPVLPAAGDETRILKPPGWLKSQGWHIIRILTMASMDGEKRRKPENKAAAPVLGEHFGSPIDASPVNPVFAPCQGLHWSKKGLCPRDLVRQTQKIWKKHQPQIAIAEHIPAAPCPDVIPSSTLKPIESHGMLARRDPTEVLHCRPEEGQNRLFVLIRREFLYDQPATEDD
jgi:hypothetical protein